MKSKALRIFSTVQTFIASASVVSVLMYVSGKDYLEIGIVSLIAAGYSAMVFYDISEPAKNHRYQSKKMPKQWTLHKVGYNGERYVHYER